MIDLSRARAGLLSDIGVPDAAGAPLLDIADARVLRDDCALRLRGKARAELFPWLRIVLAERFAAVPRHLLIRDLLMPLKHALGNAQRHGNRADPARTITVHVMLTGRGAVIAVSDEGEGFDVAGTVRRWQEQQAYFVHHGSGLRGLHRAASAVTWEDGGRTLLLGFRMPATVTKPDTPATAGNGRKAPADVRDDAALAHLLDRAWLARCLAPELSRHELGAERAASWHAYAGRGPAGDDCGVRYVLRAGDSAAPTRILIGRLHADDATAAADFDAATQLYAGRQWKGLRVPAAVLRPQAEPRLVLYEFDPWMNLWQYLAYRGSLKALRHASSRAGEALGLLHRGPMLPRRVGANSATARLHAAIAGAHDALQKLPRRADLGARFRAAIQRIEELPQANREHVCAPIHGALGWSCIHYATDGCFYFYGFEAGEQSDPAIDVGAFAADLLQFILAGDDANAYRTCRDDLLGSYNAAAPHAVTADELPRYIALTVAERLCAGASETAARQLLAVLDAAGGFMKVADRWE